jgi:hypothetical protein
MPSMAEPIRQMRRERGGIAAGPGTRKGFGHPCGLMQVATLADKPFNVIANER